MTSAVDRDRAMNSRKTVLRASGKYVCCRSSMRSRISEVNAGEGVPHRSSSSRSKEPRLWSALSSNVQVCWNFSWAAAMLAGLQGCGRAAERHETSAVALAAGAAPDGGQLELAPAGRPLGCAAPDSPVMALKSNSSDRPTSFVLGSLLSFHLDKKKKLAPSPDCSSLPHHTCGKISGCPFPASPTAFSGTCRVAPRALPALAAAPKTSSAVAAAARAAWPHRRRRRCLAPAAAAGVSCLWAPWASSLARASCPARSYTG